MTESKDCLPSGHSRNVRVGVIGLTLAVLGAVIFLAHHYFRKTFQQQIAGRDAQAMYMLWLSQQDQEPTGPADDSLNGLMDEPENQFTAILQISRLFKGVLATRLFDEKRNIVAVLPPSFSEGQVTESDWIQLSQLKPVSKFQPAVDLAELSALPSEHASAGKRPLLQISVPLHRKGESRLLGVAQFILEGESMAAEFAALDRHLFWQGFLAFLGGGSVVAAVLRLAFRQLEQANRALAERTRSLLQANQELALAAKTSAVGAVTSHLIHGLKNPLSGLQNFMASRAAGTPDDEDTAWQLAVSSTRRMQNLISQVVRVLRDENGGAHYEVSLEELAQMIAAKMSPLAEQAGVQFRTHLSTPGALANRNANLIILILENLAHNAIQATASGKSVTLEVAAVDAAIVCHVRDEGGGLPDGYEQSLFKPCSSTKEGGSGIGLAISKQLALAIGAELELKSSTAQGCDFALTIPKTLLVGTENLQFANSKLN